jgi:hypothetical protein
MTGNVKIPVELLYQTIEYLESLDIQAYDPILILIHKRLLYSFLQKKQSLERRKAYSNIISAKNDDERFDARMHYLTDKRICSDM